MLNIALFGPPGAGKGTQSETLIKEYNLFYISTGDLLRKEIELKTNLGCEAQKIIAEGGLVSDEIIVQIIEKTIKENPNAKGFLFDGFPRTYIQAYILEGLMLKLNTSLNCLINLNVNEDESTKRLIERGKTSGRIDDNEAVIKNRLLEYKQKTQPVLEFYKEKGIYFEVDGHKKIDEVKNNIKTIIENELKKHLLNIVIFGYPGSGRGSQGKAIAKKYGLEYIATGSLLEDEIKNNTKIGKEVKYYYENGLLVPDEIILPLLEKKLEETKNQKGFVFKGIPRSFVQSYILDGLLWKHKTSLSKVIEIEVPMLELVKRLDERSKTNLAMPYDASATKIVQRLEEHQKKTVPIVEKYNEMHGVIKVNGTGSFEEVFERLCNVIENKK